MIADIGTILWKEAREYLLQGPKFRGGWLGMLIFVGVFGVLMPLQSGPAWVEDPTALLVWAWLPFILVNSVVADSFAGERERHTLETLLASRLSDKSILFGKLFAAIAYGWGFSLITLLLGLITVNLAHARSGLHLFPLNTALAILVVSFLISALAAGLGVLVSLRASSVRAAQQILSTAMFVVLIPLIAIPLLPGAVQARLAQTLQNLNLQVIMMGFIIVLVAVDLFLVGLAMARFQRSRLILD